MQHSKWLDGNKLSLHMGNTECILFGSKRKLRKINNFSVKCNGHTIKAQHSVKYLGITLDDQLTGLLLTLLFKRSIVGLNFFIDNAIFRGKT